MKKLMLAATALAVAAVLGGCGRNDDDAATTASTSSAPSSSAPYSSDSSSSNTATAPSTSTTPDASTNMASSSSTTGSSSMDTSASSTAAMGAGGSGQTVYSSTCAMCHAAGVAGGADIILIPEFEYEIEEVARICRERQQGGQRFTLIAVAEGAKARGGALAVRQVVADSPDPLRLGGVCNVLEHHLGRMIDSEVRTAILGHVQRGGTPSAYDRNLATAYGAYAAALVADGQYGRMAALQQGRLTSVALAEVANRQRTVSPDAPMVATAMAVGTSFGVPGMQLRFDGRVPSALMT